MRFVIIPFITTVVAVFIRESAVINQGSTIPRYQEQFSTGGLSPWQEGFSMPSSEKNNVLIYVLGGAAVVVVFGAAVYFTGGYALILLA